MRDCVRDFFTIHAANGNNIIVHSTYVGFEELSMFKELAKKYKLSMVVLNKDGDVHDECNLPANLQLLNC